MGFQLPLPQLVSLPDFRTINSMSESRRNGPPTVWVILSGFLGPRHRVFSLENSFGSGYPAEKMSLVQG